MLNPIPPGLVPTPPEIDITGKSDADCILILGQMVRGGLLKCFYVCRNTKFENLFDIGVAFPDANPLEISITFEVTKE